MGTTDINTLTIEQYLALTRRDRPDVVIPELRNDVDFEIKSHFMSELRCNLFAGAARRWKNMLPAGSISTWDLLEKAFIMKLCPPSKTVGCKICEDVHLTKGRPLKEDSKIGLKRLKINQSLIRVVKRMTYEKGKYLMYVKDVFSSKEPIMDKDAVKLNDRCTTTLHNQPPLVQNDPGSFTLPCLIGNSKIRSVFVDLGAGINVMPFSMFKKLKIWDLQPTNMMIEMADMSMKAPRGIIENVLVQIDKFIFPIDFVIMDMVEDPNVGEEKILFKMNEIRDDPYITHESVCKIECFRETHEEELDMLLASDPQSCFMEIQIIDVEASLEQFKSVSLAYQEETSNHFERMQESIDKNKADVDKQFAELSDEVEKEELILMSMDKGDIIRPIFAVKEDLEQKLIDDLDEPLIVLESYGMINKNEFADGDVAPVAVVAPIAAIAPLEQSFVPLERIKQNQAEHHKMFIWYIILKLGYEICLGHLLTNVRLKQKPVPAQRRTWDPGITHGDILKQLLEDKVFLRREY
uniref:Reverse transcriptase domain-containing protein n=1 Tax=Tanacetum cinerariifolium TaxID=118510 RepID=A0A6L2K779_TANCI|nr:hypothetical protein [Tanacetum cinerariifolium]